MTPQEQIELLQAQLAAREAQLAEQSLALAALTEEHGNRLETLAERTQERDLARQQAADLTPPAGVVIPRSEFKRRLWPAYLALSTKITVIQDKWDRILAGLLHDQQTVSLTDPITQALVAEAVSDGLLTQSQADAVLAI